MKILPIPCEGNAATTTNDARFTARWTVPSGDSTREAFVATLESLVVYPERTSSAILRADIISDRALEEGDRPRFKITGWDAQRMIKRRLLPRNPRMDDAMTQICYFLAPSADTAQHIDASESLIVFEPLDDTRIPFYHPRVSALGFHFTREKTTISYVPLPSSDEGIANDTSTVAVDEERLDRTLLHLLSIISKHSLGYMNNYQKRVVHDVIVSKRDWQDLYTSLKGRLAGDYVKNWVESTDPKKHVFEDLGIASFLINLWRSHEDSSTSRDPLTFVDVGCGNGLLVDILLKEGWNGYGFDARNRKSWLGYDTATKKKLQQMILYPAILDSAEHDKNDTISPELSFDDAQLQSSPIPAILNYGLFTSNQFLIGNHADELTPYIPLLSALASLSPSATQTRTGSERDTIVATGFMIIPCCTHTFTGEKHNSLSTVGGRYNSYILWLITICEAVGWVVEREALRIPSTRNWAIIGRRRRLVENDQHVEDDDLEGPRRRLLKICRNLIAKHGGMAGFLKRAQSLTLNKPRCH